MQPATRTLDVSLFDSASDSNPKPEKVNFPEDFNAFREADATGKDGLLWSPAVYPPGVPRKDAFVAAVGALVLDLDAKAGAVDPVAASSVWRGVEHVVHSTFTPGAYRLVVPLSRPVTVDEHRRLYAWALARHPGADPACKNPSRIFYWPTARVDLDAPPYFRYVPGETLDPDRVGLTSAAAPRSGVAPSHESMSPGERHSSPGASAFAGIEHPEQREDIALIEERCAFMRHARDDAATLLEPEWYAALSIWARCRDGEKLAHERSFPHPGYTRDDTAFKFTRAQAVGPATCAHIRALSPACRGCPLAVTSPVLLGRRLDAATPHPAVGESGAAPADETPDPTVLLQEAEAALLQARVDEDAAHVKKQQALAALAVARRHGTPDGVEDATRAKIAADGLLRETKAKRAAAEKAVVEVKRNHGIEGLPAGADVAVWARLQKTQQRDGSVAPSASIGNILAVLEHDPRWSRRLAFNAFSLEVCLDRTPMPETAATEIAAQLCYDYNLDASTAKVIECVAVVAHRRKFNPVQEWLDGLAWDGTARMDQLLTRGFGGAAEDTGLLALLGRKFLISMVARAFKAGAQVDTMLVLAGGQGLYKSRGLEMLAGSEWFGRTKLTVGDKDAYLQMQGRWLYEIDEMQAIKKADVTASKSWLTNSTDRFRAPYARRAEDHPRRTVLAGSTNERRFLLDATGDRRYWPFLVGSKVDLVWIKENREALFAEAVAAYRAGEAWWFDTGSAEAERLNAHNESFRLQHPWCGPVLRWMRTRKQPFSEVMVLTECIQMPLADIKNFDKTAMIDVLRSLGCEPEMRTVDGHTDWWYTTPERLRAPAPAGNGKVIEIR